jgi:mRNA-degrading endonuclease HigB of HigAB toxin-antitoxin module
MLEQSKPAAQELRTPSEARKLMSEYDITIIGFFASTESIQFQAFSDAAETTRPEFKLVGYTTDPSVFKAYKAKPNDVIIFYPKIFHSKFEEKTKTYNKVGNIYRMIKKIIYLAISFRFENFLSTHILYIIF